VSGRIKLLREQTKIRLSFLLQETSYAKDAKNAKKTERLFGVKPFPDAGAL
jgi:hypothetical protein